MSEHLATMSGTATRIRALSLFGVLTCLAADVLIAHSERHVIIWVVGCVVLLAVYAHDADALPAMALAAGALIPINYLNLPGRLEDFNPATLLILWWSGRIALRQLVSSRQAQFVRERSHSRSYRLTMVAFGLFTVFLLIGTIYSADIGLTIRWDVSFVGSCIVVVLLGRTQWRAILNALWLWPRISGVLGFFALYEFAHKYNPLFGSFYQNAPTNPILQIWTVYRVTTTLGHPLVNGAFFAVGATLCWSEFVRLKSYRALILLLPNVAGVLLSGSRGALLACGVGIAIETGVALGAHSSRRRALFLGIAALLMVGTFGTTLASTVVARIHSSQGEASVDERFVLFDAGYDLMLQRPLTGFGPGALSTVSSTLGDGLNGDYEDALLEMGIALGIGGGLTFVAMLILAECSAIASRSEGGSAGALASYIISLASFNVLEGYKGIHIFLGILLAGSVLSENRRGGIREAVAGAHLNEDSLAFRVDLAPIRTG